MLHLCFYVFQSQHVKFRISNEPGTLSMANTGQPNSGGSQFFMNVVPWPRALEPPDLLMQWIGWEHRQETMGFTMTGWCFGTSISFSHILGIIIPID